MALWFATRAFGLVSLALFSSVMVLGLLTAGRRAPLRQAFVVTGLHRSLALLSPAFLGLHIAANVLDGYVTIRWLDAVVPFVSAYRPFWLGLGAIAFDIVVVLIITSLLRVRLGLRAWRAIHWLAYACWPIAIVHGIGVGTDRGLTFAFTGACVLAVVTAAALRFTAVRRLGPAPSLAARRDHAMVPALPRARLHDHGGGWRAGIPSRDHAGMTRPRGDGGGEGSPGGRWAR